MNVINVLSSHYDGSFVQALHTAFCAGLDDAGHQHETVDLYKAAFNPVMQGDDFNQFFGKELPEDVVRMHALLAKADVLTFFYPVWWNDMPAIMKGWVDRMFTKGFAYDYSSAGAWGTLPVKKVILICTLGNPRTQEGEVLENAMRVKEANGVFGYCGVDQVDHHFLYEVDNKALRETYLKQSQDLGRELRLEA